MATIINITIEQSSNNILVDYQDSSYDAQGNVIGTINTRKGFNPLILQDWTDAQADATISQYAAIAWAGLTEPGE